MKIFISWSKAKSKELAIKTKEILEILENLTSSIDAFVSEIDINGGDTVQELIIKKITECDKLVLCFTKENKTSPWLLFEAGYAKGLGKTVIPILFDSDPNWHSWIDNPMNIARELRFDNDDFIDSFMNSFDIKCTTANYKKVENYRNDILNIKDKYRLVDAQCEDFLEKLIHNDKFIAQSPYFKEKTAYFLTGFESNDLYKAIIESFLYTGKYLWIYGRKNMKLFSGDHNNLFEYLTEKYYSSDSQMDGIDFRCLFLDPDCEEVKKAHMHQDIFESELKSTIARAKRECKKNPGLKKCLRFYSNKREEIIIRLDNCIIYSRPHFDAQGFPQILTNTGFEIFSATSNRGKMCLEKYENVWKNSRIIPI